MTAVADEIGVAFEAALAKDAGADGPAEVPAPPRQPDRDPDAPHGRGEDGTPLAPHGLAKSGRPRLRPPGPGRPKEADRPRVTASAAPKAAAAAPDYSEALMELGTAVWLGASSIRGGRLGPLRLPDARPYAAAFRSQMPALVAAWNTAAQQNATVRGYIESLTGDGGKAWVIGVAVSAAGLVGSCIELARSAPDVRAQWAQMNDAAVAEYIGRAAGVEAS